MAILTVLRDKKMTCTYFQTGEDEFVGFTDTHLSDLEACYRQISSGILFITSTRSEIVDEFGPIGRNFDDITDQFE